MAAEQAIPSEPVLQLPLIGHRGDRRVLAGWASVADDEFSRNVLLLMNWSLTSYGYARNGGGNHGGPASRSLHRFVYEHYFGLIPAKLDIDHIDRNPLNNLPSNLRAVTHSVNLANAGMFSHNTSGFRGVRWYKPRRKWQARIKVQRKDIHLGYFFTARAAADAVNQAYQKYFPEVQIPNP